MMKTLEPRVEHQLNSYSYAQWYLTLKDRKPGIRIGQSFCNYFGIQDTELFYMKDEDKTFKKIKQYLRDYQY